MFTGGVQLYASDGSSLCLQEGFNCTLVMGRHCVYRRGSTDGGVQRRAVVVNSGGAVSVQSRPGRHSMGTSRCRAV